MTHIIEQAERCLQCKKPSCSAKCPVQTPIPQAIALFQEDKLRQAGELLFRNNPLSAICSIICPHENNCFGHCILNKKGLPVEFFLIEQYISGFYLQTFKAPAVAKTGKRVGVVGSGPAGIAMAILLSARGYDVTLFDKKEQIGGVLRYGIPEFRLPKSILDRYDEILYEMGVKFRPNTPIGQSITVDDMMLDGYQAIFLATGTSRPNRLGLLGETLGHVHYAVDFLKSPDSYRLGDKVAVIGAGNVAMDAARMAVRKSSRSQVCIIHHREEQDMTGSREEIAMARIDGVQFIHCCSTIRITNDQVICARVDVSTDAAGNRAFEENFTDLRYIPADTVIVALGQGPQADYLKSMAAVATTERGLIAINEDGSTSRPGVYAAGDIVTGPKTVVEAVAAAKQIADRIDDYLSGS